MLWVSLGFSPVHHCLVEPCSLSQQCFIERQEECHKGHLTRHVLAQAAKQLAARRAMYSHCSQSAGSSSQRPDAVHQVTERAQWRSNV